MTDRHSGRGHLEKFLHAHQLDFEEVNETTIAVVVPGEKKLTTTASFAFGDTTVTVNAFVIRHPDENDLAVYRWLLERNRRMYGLAYSIDHHGDIYLTGRFPLDAITDDEVIVVLYLCAEISTPALIFCNTGLYEAHFLPGGTCYDSGYGGVFYFFYDLSFIIIFFILKRFLLYPWHN